MTKRSIKLLTVLIPAAILVGCGQMGPLYLPKENSSELTKSAETSNVAKTNTPTTEATDSTTPVKKTDKSAENLQDTSALASANDQTATKEPLQSEENTQSQQ